MDVFETYNKQTNKKTIIIIIIIIIYLNNFI